jgi:hypothetical protein
MPKVIDAARVSTRGGAVWRQCGACGRLSALPPSVTRCAICERLASGIPGVMRSRHRVVKVLAGPGIGAARQVYTSVPSDVLRVAALVEIAAAAAALARTVVKMRHLDAALIAPHVSDAVDLRAVLGRGQWLPTMVRHVPAPASGPVPAGVVMPAVAPSRPRRVRRRPAGEPGLFPASGAAAVGGGA